MLLMDFLPSSKWYVHASVGYRFCKNDPSLCQRQYMQQWATAPAEMTLPSVKDSTCSSGLLLLQKWPFPLSKTVHAAVGYCSCRNDPSLCQRQYMQQWATAPAEMTLPSVKDSTCWVSAVLTALRKVRTDFHWLNLIVTTKWWGEKKKHVIIMLYVISFLLWCFFQFFYLLKAVPVTSSKSPAKPIKD